MGIDKISITLYDLLGYLLPGYILLFALSILEATFLNSTVLSLSNYERHPIPLTAAAYFLGQISHSLASEFDYWVGKRFGGSAAAPKTPVPSRVRSLLGNMYHVQDPDESLLLRVRSLFGGITQAPDPSALNDDEIIQLADGYVLASGGSPERDVMLIREGFFETSMMCFALCGLTLLSTLARGGIYLRVQPPLLVQYGPGQTVLFAGILAALAFLCLLRFNLFRQLHANIILTLFLAYREKDLLAHPPAPPPK